MRFVERGPDGLARVSPHMIADAFAKVLSKTVNAQIVPRGDWEAIFREQGMQNPQPRMQMIDGFNEGWIDFRKPASDARTGRIAVSQAIAALSQNADA